MLGFFGLGQLPAPVPAEAAPLTHGSPEGALTLAHLEIVPDPVSSTSNADELEISHLHPQVQLSALGDLVCNFFREDCATSNGTQSFFHDLERTVNACHLLDNVVPYLYDRADIVLEMNKGLPAGFYLHRLSSDIIVSLRPSAAKAHFRSHQNYSQRNIDFPKSLITSTSREKVIELLSHYVKFKDILPPYPFRSDMEKMQGSFSWNRYADGYKVDWEGKNAFLKVSRVFPKDREFVELSQGFVREALRWSSLDHINILPFLGVHIDPCFRFGVVSLFMKNGNIMEYLKVNPKMDKISAIRDVACGLEFLHSCGPPIVHGFICGANILVNDDLLCCIGDSVLASVMESRTTGESSSRCSKDSARWLAPELLEVCSSDLQDRSPWMKPSRDIYAFGCTALEIVTEQLPFAHLKEEVLKSGAPTFGPRAHLLPVWLGEIITRCCQKTPSDRPSASEILTDVDAGKRKPSSEEKQTEETERDCSVAVSFGPNGVQ